MSSDIEDSSPAQSPERSASKKRKRDEQDEDTGEDRQSASPSSSANANDTKSDKNTTTGRPKKRQYTKRSKSGNEPPLEIEANGNSSSPFIVQTTSFFVPLAPIAQGSPLEGLCAEHLSPLLLSYVQSFKGVVLSYSNARFSTSAAGPTSGGDNGPESSQALAKSIAEYAAAYTWITADFTLLKPSRYSWIEGYVTVQSRTHLGLVCWNLFNASIERKRMPEGWSWVPASSTSFSKNKHHKRAKLKDKGGVTADDIDHEDAEEADTEPRGSEAHGVEGYWSDATGVKVDGLLRFRVRDLETTPSFGKENGFVSIEGSLLDDAAEFKMDRREAISAGRAKAAAARRAAAAATSN